jgi:hypothetical protein
VDRLAREALAERSGSSPEDIDDLGDGQSKKI